MGHHPPRVKRASGNSPPTLPEQVGERRKENGASVRMGGLYRRAAAIASQRLAAVRGIVGDAPRMLDLFAGCGTFSLPLAEQASQLERQRQELMLRHEANGQRRQDVLNQLQLLERALSEAPERHHLVCFHHHPVSIGCRWMEPIGLRNPDALFAVLERYPQVRAVLWGHIHQEIDELRNNVRMLASPSTCVQFKPESGNFAVGEQAPGYRWFDLFADGRIETQVERADHIEFIIDMNSKGY